jgi:hypothetical protein
LIIEIIEEENNSEREKFPDPTLFGWLPLGFASALTR